MAPEQSLQVVQDPEQAELVMHPTRRRLLSLLAEPNSAAGVAEQLGMPRQKVNYHVRELEEAGLAELVEERKKGNCVERVVQASAASYVIGPQSLGPLASSPEKVNDRYSLEYLIAVGERLIGELAALLPQAREGPGAVPTLSVETRVAFQSVEERAAFARDLTNEIARLISRYHREDAPSGEAFRLILAVHPAPAE
jgi:DNA-binding transcriptional ArsR family regulator